MSKPEDYVARVAFAYPNEEGEKKKWEQQSTKPKLDAAKDTIGELPRNAIESLCFDYRIKGKADALKPVRSSLLDRAGEIQLPPTRCRLVRNCTDRPALIAPDDRPVCGSLRELLPLEFQQVRRTAQEPLFDSLIEQYHYLRYQQPVGEHLNYLVSANGQAIACRAWSSAVRHLASRDRFIGRSTEVRKRNLHLLAYSSRVLILPWVTVAHLASHILGRMAKLVPRDWQALYAHPIYWLETFIDPARFHGTCYRAGNWVALRNSARVGRAATAPLSSREQPKSLFPMPL